MTTGCAELWPTMVDHKTEQAEIARVFLERLLALMEREGIDPEKGEHLAAFVGVSKSSGYNWLTPGKTPSAPSTVSPRSLSQAVLVQGHRPNHLLHFFIGVFTLSAWWWFVWLPISIFGGEKRALLTVDEYGNAAVKKGV